MIKYLLFTLLVVQELMAYSESPYKVVHQTDKYEIRFYEERLVVKPNTLIKIMDFENFLIIFLAIINKVKKFQ